MQVAEKRKKEEAEAEERRKKGILSGREIFSQVRPRQAESAHALHLCQNVLVSLWPWRSAFFNYDRAPQVQREADGRHNRVASLPCALCT